MESKTKKITITAMLSAMAFVMVLFVRIPVVLFLEYEPKDIVITLGGLIWGPWTAFAVSVAVSGVELVTISTDGILGFLMNIISTCSFACTAAYIYRKRRTLSGAVAGLWAGVFCMVSAMLLWNYLITPVYMGLPREAVAKLLLPAFLPFNLLKGGWNAAFVFLTYKPVITALRKAGYLPVSRNENVQEKNPVGWRVIPVAVMVTCTLLVLALNGTI